jgi:uncharacterized cupin superfamily protein
MPADARVVMLPSRPATAGEEYFVAPEKRIEGNPRQTVWLDYADATAEFSAGLWSSDVGEWRIRYTEEEYCRLLEGRSVITDDSGHAVTVCAGDEFTIPAGFSGTWRVVEPTLKRFVIHERNATQGR